MIAEVVYFAAGVRTLAGGAPELIVDGAVAVADGRILAVGTAAELRSRTDLICKETREEHLGDAVIVPGLTDSHTHPVLGLDMARGAQLTDLDRERVRAALAAEVSRVGSGSDGAGWVLGWGLDPNVFTETGFDGRGFDDVTGPIPMALTMRDGHSMVVNSAAIQAAGITGAEVFTDESHVGVDDAGHPTGYLVEFQALNLVTSAIPPESFSARVDRLLATLRGFAETGIASTHSMDFVDGTRELLEAIEAAGELPVRLRFSPWVEAGASTQDLERVAALQGIGGRRWSVEGVKLFIDGTVDNGSAWLREPDAYGEGTVSVWSDPGDYARVVAFFAERGIPTATHAIGDRGVEFALDALEAAGGARERAAHRIEHIETIPDELVPRFAELGVAASMQPVHGTHHTLADRSDNWSVRLGPERAAHGWRCQDLRRAGAIVALGSDWPITPFDPRAMMADSILRRPVERPAMRPVQPEQALSPMQALEGYTTHAAAAAGLSGVAGSIEPGKRADLTAFGADPLTLTAEALAEVPIVATVVDGRRVV